MLQRSVENFVIGYNDDTRCEQAVVMTWLREDWGGGEEVEEREGQADEGRGTRGVGEGDGTGGQGGGRGR
jgi:hypothetical protein